MVVVRFGLPVNFQPILMVPFKKTERQLREVLHRLFGYLDTSAAASGVDVSSCIRHCDILYKHKSQLCFFIVNSCSKSVPRFPSCVNIFTSVAL